MSNEDNIRIGIISPPDRELLTAEIMVGNQQWAELNQEGGKLQLEFYRRQDGQPWVMGFDITIQALANAKEKLCGGE